MDGGRKHMLILLSILWLISRLNSGIKGHSMELDKPSIDQRTKHFVLVHGSGHGAWCWYKVTTLLRSAGHRVTALDLAASGIDPTQVDDLRSISDYFRPLMKFMGETKDRIILVGHSLGGLALARAMESFPEKITAAVFVTALMPGPALNVSTLQRESLSRQGPQMDNKFTYGEGEGPNKPPTTFSFGPNFMASNVYQLSPPEDITLGTMLVRPLRLFSEEELSKDIVLTDEKFGTVSRVFVISEEDKLTDKELVRWMLKINPPHKVMKVEGSDHMVMFSKPQELCACLLRIALPS